MSATPRPLAGVRPDDASRSSDRVRPEELPARERLLDAAERLIGNGGVEALSMRAVTRAAGLSVSAVNYHFGSKDALVRETLRRAFGPLSAKRLARLEALEADACDVAPSVEALLEAFLRPAVALRSREGSRSYRLLWARLHLGTAGAVAQVKGELLNPAFQRYLDALERALPDRDREALALAFQLALGSALHVLGGHAEDLADVQRLDDEALLDRLVRFGAAGIRAVAPRRDARREEDR